MKKLGIKLNTYLFYNFITFRNVEILVVNNFCIVKMSEIEEFSRRLKELSEKSLRDQVSGGIE